MTGQSPKPSAEKQGLGPELTSQLNSARAHLKSEASKQHDQWRLFLTGGNGGGLLAVSAILVTDAGARWTDALLCSAWLFALGLISAGILPILQVVGGRGLGEIIQSVPLAFSQDISKSKAELLPTLNRLRTRIKIAGWAERVLEPLSALSFLIALLVPLISFSLFGR